MHTPRSNGSAHRSASFEAGGEVGGPDRRVQKGGFRMVRLSERASEEDRATRGAEVKIDE